MKHKYRPPSLHSRRSSLIVLLVFSIAVVIGVLVALNSDLLSTFGSGGGQDYYQPTRERYNHWSLPGDGDSFRRDFKLEVVDLHLDNSNVHISLTGFPAGIELLRGIEYVDVAYKSHCREDLFREGSTRLVSGYQIPNMRDIDISQSERMNFFLPVFTSEQNNHLCVRVELWDNAITVGGRQHAVKLFVTYEKIETLLASAQRLEYERLAVKHTDYNTNSFLGSLGSPDNQFISALDERFLLYAAFDSEAAHISMTFNMPGKVRYSHGADIQGFSITGVKYIFVDNDTDCDENIFKPTTRINRMSRNTSAARNIQTYRYPSSRLAFNSTASTNGKYLCIKADIKGDVSHEADFNASKIFSYEVGYKIDPETGLPFEEELIFY